MKRALIAVDPSNCTDETFERFAGCIHHFQQRGVLPNETTLASVFHATLTAVPYELYLKEKNFLMGEAQKTVEKMATNRFNFDSVRILESTTSSAEDHVQQLSNYAKEIGADLIVLGSNDRSGLSYWLMGSFSETALRESEVPILVFSCQSKKQTLSLSNHPAIVIAVDVDDPPTEGSLRWINNFAAPLKASVELIHVLPIYRPLLEMFHPKKNRSEATAILEIVKGRLEAFGLKTNVSVRDERDSIGSTISEFATEKGAWVVVTVGVERTAAHNLLVESAARQTLASSKCPVLNVRLV